MIYLSFILYNNKKKTLVGYEIRDKINVVCTIVIKPGSGVDPAKGPGPGFYGSTRVNPG